VITGDPVWYRQAVRGGYDCALDVPATFVRATPRRVTVQVVLKDATTIRIHVSPKNVRPRDPAAVWR
jgi:hypothetical protein